MKPRNSLRLLVAAGLSLGVVPQLYAAGTTAGQVISNTATVEYEVGGVDQTPVDSNTTTFVVDRKIDFTVAEVGGAATQVVPSATGRVTTFTVTNVSNAVLDFRLDAANVAAGDDFQATITGVFVESGANAGYQALEDTATYIDELAVSGSRTVYVVATIPGTVVNGDLADVTLSAIAAQSVNGTTGAYVATVGSLAADAVANPGDADDADVVDTVFAEPDGDVDGLYDGIHSDTDTYSVVTASLSVTKGSTVVTDPFNCTTPGDPLSCGTNLPKAVPGAVVEYCLDVENLGASAADSIVLTDAIPANTTYVAGSIKTASTGTGAACDVGTGTTEDDAANGDGDFLATPAPRGSVVIRSTSVPALDRFKAVFRVTVD
ncbi:MAG: conserved repeat domain [Moraxellaceae bacterium]|jgi:uncharacterized repeat protein (TIGR01451 family)|nr:conserved repeat domain [Moraxellaceae bacterium]